MKIKIFDKHGKEIFSGNYCYTEGGYTDGNPSFHIDIHKERVGDSEVHFFCESMDEFNEFLKDIKESIEEN